MTEPVRPYGDCAQTYVDAGWQGVLPIPPRAKKPVPAGFTGHNGKWPSAKHIEEWMLGTPEKSIALRVPGTVIGIDVDQYGPKHGHDRLLDAIEHLGELPATWVSTSRPAPSGIRLFRVPDGSELKTAPLPNVEIVQFHHRYMVVWPSLHRDTGDEYRWVTPDGEIAHRPPRPDELPDLPAKWLDALLARTEKTEPANNDVPNAHREHHWSPSVISKFDDTVSHLVAGSRHDSATAGAMGLARLEQLGDSGSTAALEELGRRFITAITAPGTGQRKPNDADIEWRDILESARHLAMTTASTRGPTIDDIYEPSAATAGEGGQQANDDDGLPDAEDWLPRDLSEILAGGIERPVPTLLDAAGSVPLLYDGRVNSIFGESGVGKTWVTLLAIAQVIQGGGIAMMVDLEDTPHGLIPRLRDLGLTSGQITDQFIYVAPETPWGLVAAETMRRVVSDRMVDLVVIDSTGEAMAMGGVKGNDDDDVARWFRSFPRRIADMGTCVLLTDHIPKDPTAPSSYSIGSQRKRAAINGASYRVDAIKAPSLTEDGKLKIIVAKDRHGTRPVGAVAAIVTFTAGDHTTVNITKPDSGDVAAGDKWRPTVMMERVSRHLEDNPGASQRTILADVEGRDGHLRKALGCLVEEGHVEQEKNARGFSYVVVRPFRDIDDLTETVVDNPVDNPSEADRGHRGPPRPTAARPQSRDERGPPLQTPPYGGVGGPRSEPPPLADSSLTAAHPKSGADETPPRPDPPVSYLFTDDDEGDPA